MKMQCHLGGDWHTGWVKCDHGFGKLLYSFVSFVHPKNDLNINL